LTIRRSTREFLQRKPLPFEPGACPKPTDHSTGLSYRPIMHPELRTFKKISLLKRCMINVENFYQILLTPRQTTAHILQETSFIEASIFIVMISLILGLWKGYHSKRMVNGMYWFFTGAIGAIALSAYATYAGMLFGGLGTIHSNLIALMYAIIVSIELFLANIVLLFLMFFLFLFLLIFILMLPMKVSDPLIVILFTLFGITYAGIVAGSFGYVFSGILIAANNITLISSLILLAIPMIIYLLTTSSLAKRLYRNLPSSLL